MSARLQDAVSTLNRRKASVNAECARRGVSLTMSEARGLAVGLDVDLDEAHTFAIGAAETALEALHHGRAAIDSALTGTWVDGLLTGLLLAEQRKAAPE